MKKKITTLITYYYGEKYFKDLILSIRNNIILIKESINSDIIIINDSSNFEEEKKIENIIQETKIEKIAKVILINNETNMGVTASRYKGILNVKSDYLHIMDQDDYIKASTYSDFLSLPAQKSIGVGVFDGYKIKNGKILGKIIKKHPFSSTNLNNPQRNVYGVNKIITPGMCIYSYPHINKLLEIYEFMVNYGNLFDGIDDGVTYYYLLKNGIYFNYINKFDYYYRLHDQNQRNKKREKVKAIEGFKLIKENLSLEIPSDFFVLREALSDLLNKKYFSIVKNFDIFAKYLFYKFF